MAFTQEQEAGLLDVLAAFTNGKRINDLENAQGALKDMSIEVMDETGETRKMSLSDAVEQAENPVAGRFWIDANATPTAAGYYGSLAALRALPEKLGLGRYLVLDDRTKRKLDPTDSTRYADGTPAALDGSQGQCMWCWNGFYANIFKEGGKTVKAITFNAPIGNGYSVFIPAGGISWFDAGVIDRTNNKLCSVISLDARYRGGAGSALNAASYSHAPAADSPQLTMLGMPATQKSTTEFGNLARARGEGWEANWFVARFVVTFLFEVIMGTQNSQAAFSATKDSDGLYQGGFGTGVTDMPDWGNYNGAYPCIPTSVGLEAGDGVCLVDYDMPDAEGGVYHTFHVPVFFGLVTAGYGHLWRWVRGLTISQTAGEKTEVYVSPSMYAQFDPTSVDAQTFLGNVYTSAVKCKYHGVSFLITYILTNTCAKRKCSSYNHIMGRHRLWYLTPARESIAFLGRGWLRSYGSSFFYLVGFIFISIYYVCQLIFIRVANIREVLPSLCRLICFFTSFGYFKRN